MPAARITTTDLARLEQVSRILLTPLTAPSLDAWRAPAASEAARLLGADKATFILPCDGEPLSYCEGNYPMTPDYVTGYMGALSACEKEFGLWRKMVSLGTFRRSDLYSPAVYRSSYYSDWIVPARAYDSVGISLELGPKRTPVAFWFHHDQPRGRRFGAAGHALLAALLPSFRVGAEAWSRLAGRRERLGALLDELADPLILVDREGSVVHTNVAALRLLAADPFANRIDHSVKALACEVARALEPASRAKGLSRPERRLRTPYDGYALTAFAPPPDLQADGLVLVRLQSDRADKLATALPDARVLMKRFGLTRREVVVAQLLAKRRTNAEIAAALCISPHTALRHTERIREKLGVRSRLNVATRLTASLGASRGATA